MMNNTDDVYSKPIPLQYPKVGEDPSSCKVGIADLSNAQTQWIEVPGDPKQHYIPGMQWVNEDVLLLQQLNRHQNHLKIYTYTLSSQSLKVVYEEKTDTWIDLSYPDATNPGWNGNDLTFSADGQSFLRMIETDDWRRVIKVNVFNSEQTIITNGDYDIASVYQSTPTHLYFSASPDNSMQRYLFHITLDGKGTGTKLTPDAYPGINKYDIAPNGKYAIHHHSAATSPRTTRLVKLPSHETIKILADNQAFKDKLEQLDFPKVEFFEVTTEDGIDIDGRMILPGNFDSSKKYPVLFHVYGEPWGQVAKDDWIGMWNIMLAQQGIIVIDMDNRGTPCLKGSEWRKSIYRKIGVINASDQGQAIKEVLKKPYLDADRSGIWGWSGGGSMTLNIMFQYPGLVSTGISVAPVSNQLVYDNIYQERYMGLPQENPQDFEKGSPITYAHQLEGNLLLIHGTGDDNVHYQSSEMVKLLHSSFKKNFLFFLSF